MPIPPEMLKSYITAVWRSRLLSWLGHPSPGPGPLHHAGQPGPRFLKETHQKQVKCRWTCLSAGGNGRGKSKARGNHISICISAL